MASKWKWKEVYIKEDLLREVNMGKRKEGGKMKIRSRCHKSTDKEAICEDCMQKELDAQEVYERNVQNYMDHKFQDEEEAACRNER